MMSKITNHISFKDCKFNKGEKGKDSTARISLWRDLRIINVYTLEASFLGYSTDNQINRHFNIKDLLNLGKNLC